ncbi:MAG: hypothetical protein AMJ46_12620 [Latescibacteria bacterium DG_63]|nr:MAG: hypothetical protein AMJ46_12620 [Latescibacteria bacterium DG_63]
MPAAAMVTYLAANVGALTAGTNLFEGPVRPVGTGIPDKAVFVLATGGPAPEPFLAGDASSPDEERVHSLLIRVRSEPGEFNNGQTLARSVRDAAHRASVAGYLDVSIRECDPAYLGADDEGRHEWSIGVDMEIQE